MEAQGHPGEPQGPPRPPKELKKVFLKCYSFKDTLRDAQKTPRDLQKVSPRDTQGSLRDPQKPKRSSTELQKQSESPHSFFIIYYFS